MVTMFAKQNGETISRKVKPGKVSTAKKRGWSLEAPKAEKPKAKPKKKAVE